MLAIGRAVKGSRRLWTWAVLAGVSFLVPYALIATFVGPPQGGRMHGAAEHSHPVPGPGITGSGHPPHPPLRQALEGVTVEWETGTGFSGGKGPRDSTSDRLS